MTVYATNQVIGNYCDKFYSPKQTFDGTQAAIKVFDFGKPNPENTLPPTPGCTLPPTEDGDI